MAAVAAAATAVAPVAMDDVMSALLAKFPALATLGAPAAAVLAATVEQAAPAAAA
jgi:hypothetical protein